VCWYSAYVYGCVCVWICMCKWSGCMKACMCDGVGPGGRPMHGVRGVYVGMRVCGGYA